MKQEAKRWYDKNKGLAKQLDNLIKVDPKQEYEVIKGLMDLIQNSNPEILNKFVIPRDIERWYRRWYDKDPTYWLVLNGLKHADDELLKKVAEYLGESLKSQ